MKTIFYIILLTVLNGCSFNCTKDDILFSQNTLPIALVGVKYHTKIHTTNATINNIYVDGVKEVEINGLKITTSETRNEKGDGEVVISGKPQNEGEILFHIQVGTVGTQCPGREINKKFKIMIRNN